MVDSMVMDIDTIRFMVGQGWIEFSDEALKRMVEREIESDQIIDVIYNGRIIREEPKQKKGFPKCTIFGHTNRKVAGVLLPELQGLYVACAVGDEVVITTTYWEEE